MYAPVPGCLEGGPSSSSPDSGGGRWYFSRRELEEDSPSRSDGIDLKKETYLRKSYCTYLQDLGMRLKVPQVTIATAIIFCHRFFLRQSHAKNDRRTIATVCMFLAGKVEETPRPLKDVILVSYEIIQKKDPAAAQRIKQKEVYEQQKELILVGERVVLATLAFDLNVHHPYKPLVEAIKKLKVAQNALAQVAWNFVNDGLRTSLCLQFKPHHIAAGAIFLAAKFLKVKLPSDGEKVWWQEFDVTPRQLEEVSNQMLELYEQNRVPPPTQGSEVEGSTTAGGGPNGGRSSAKVMAVNEKQMSSVNSHAQAAGAGGGATTVLVKPLVLSSSSDKGVAGRSNNDNGSTELSSVVTMDHQKVATVVVDTEKEQDSEEVSYKSDVEDPKMVSKSSSSLDDDECGKQKTVMEFRAQDAIKMIDKDKVKAALEKRKKFRVGKKNNNNLNLTIDDEDDLIERELEYGVELAVKNDEKRNQHQQHEEDDDDDDDLVKNVEEGEMVVAASPLLRSCSNKRKGGSPLSIQSVEDGGAKKKRHSLVNGE